MPLKYKIEESKITEVPEAQRTLYVKRDGFMYLDVDGVVDSDTHAEFRNNNRDIMRVLGVSDMTQAKTRLEALKDIDPAAHTEMTRKMKEYETGKHPKLDELLTERTATMRTDNEKIVKGKDGEIKNLREKLEKHLIDDALATAAVTKGVIATAVEDVKLRGRTVFRLDGEEVVAIDAMGKQMFGKDGRPLGILEWMDRLATDAKHLFEANRGGGSGGGKGNVSYDKPNPYSRKTMNLTEQGKLERENPTLAKQLQVIAQSE